MWKITYGDGSEPHTSYQNKVTDAKSGNYSLHFYSAKAVDFRVEQTITGLKNGYYNLSMFLQGGDAEHSDMNLFAVTGSKELKANTSVNGWAQWSNPEIKNILVTDGNLTIGADIKADGGAWGTLDDFYVSYVKAAEGTETPETPEAPIAPENPVAPGQVPTQSETITNVENDGAAPDQKLSIHDSYMKGYSDGTFKPNQSITRAEIAAILSRVGAGQNSNMQPVDYTDKEDFRWATNDILQVTSHGLMTGYKDGSFGPNLPMTRAEMATVVARWMNLSGQSTSTFPDTIAHWSTHNIAQVQEAGYMKGMPDGSFGPDKLLSRAEAVTVINRVLKRGPLFGSLTPGWSDVAQNHWAFHDIEEATVSHSYTIRTDGGEDGTKINK